MLLTISLLSLLILFPCLVLLGEALGAVLPVKSPIQENLPQKIAVLIPAHNEAAVIALTLASVSPQLRPQDSLLVVADNCTDSTAQIAKDKGAQVLERFDSEHRGKGYALAYALETLEIPNPEVVVLLDADCELGTKALSLLAAQAFGSQKPVQGKYILASPPQPSIKDLLSGFAFLMKNWVRPLGLDHLGYPCLLTGAGMAFPWEILRQAPLASGNIVEDMQLGIDLAIAGHAPQFCPEAEIKGILPQGVETATKQRTRWEHGHLSTLVQECPRLIRAAWQQKRIDLLVLAAEVSVPPLSLLVLAWLGLAGLTTVATLTQLVGILPLLITLAGGLALLLSVIIAWAGFARSFLPLTTLLLVPVYLLWKIPLYLNFFRRRQKEWIKTDRLNSHD